MNNKILKLSDIKIDKKFQLNIHDREQNVVSIDEIGSDPDSNLVVKDEDTEMMNQPYLRTIKLLKTIKYE